MKKRSLIIACLSFAVVIVFFVWGAVSPFVPALAANDPISSMYNFSVDSDVFDTYWTDDSSEYCIYDTNSTLLGKVFADYGVAVCSTKYGGYTYFSFLFNITTSPNNYSSGFYGGLDKIEIEASLPSDVEYLISSPTSSSQNTIWTVGGNVGISGVGISANCSFNGSVMSVLNTSNRGNNSVFIRTGIVFPWYLITSNDTCFSVGALQDNHFQFIVSCKTLNANFAYAVFTIRALFCKYTPFLWGWNRSNSVGIQTNYLFSFNY